MISLALELRSAYCWLLSATSSSWSATFVGLGKLALDIGVFAGSAFDLLDRIYKGIAGFKTGGFKVNAGKNQAAAASDIFGNLVDIVVKEPARLPISMLVEILLQLLIDVLNAERLNDLTRQELTALHFFRNILALIHIKQSVNGVRQGTLCFEGVAKLQVRVGRNRPSDSGGDIGGRCHAAQFIPILLLLQFNSPFQQAVLVYEVAVLLVVPLNEFWRDADNLFDNLLISLIVVG